jgi:molybdenum cofactor biosynthesis protein B
MSHTEHKALSPAVAHCYILTISDTRSLATDASGRAICDLLWAGGHLANADVQVIITTGGTGITSRDTTCEAISGLLDKTLDGFGELFRMLSYQEIGSAAMLSRAVGGLAKGRVILSLPGSEAAVHLAMTKLILPELGHLVREASR